MKQDIAFNPAQAGTIHNFCLDNVRKGFGIENKYASAWQAWENTQQHPDRNIPDGLDVPLFYSYTANIDGVTQNYGHINVRLADGTVWSDGTIYANLDAYLYNHYPQYVGWGESINDFKIIEGDTMTKEQAAELALYIRLLAFESVDEANTHSEDDVAHILADPGYAAGIAKAVYQGEWQIPADKAGRYAELEKEYEDLKATPPADMTPVGNIPTPMNPPAVGLPPTTPVFPELHTPQLTLWQKILKALIGEK